MIRCNPGAALTSLVIIIVAACIARAQGQSAGLEKTDKGFKHAASGTEFIVPDKWEARPPRPLPNGVSVDIKSAAPRITISLFWVPLEGKLLSDYIHSKPEGTNKSYGRDHDSLKLYYGADKVGNPEEIKVGDRVAYKIPIGDGPDKDGAMVGVLYIWEAGVNAQDRWRIKLRATYPKKDQADHAKKVQALLSNIK